MFDLGDTLVDARLQPFADVPAALAAISGMRCADGSVVKTCVVSDWHLADPPLPATSRRIKPLVDAFLARFDRTGLRASFEPVARRVTLSTHAGEMKPARSVFTTALARLRVRAPLAECLFITENLAHVKAARRSLGMQALRFRAGVAGARDFDAWSQVPALVAHALDANRADNLERAARVHLAARGMELASLERSGGRWIAQGQVWHPVTVPTRADLGTVHVGVPAQAALRRGSRGQIDADVPRPRDEDVAEAEGLVASLAEHGEIGDRPTASHRLETGADGRQRLVRRGFSAV